MLGKVRGSPAGARDKVKTRRGGRRRQSQAAAAAAETGVECRERQSAFVVQESRAKTVQHIQSYTVFGPE